MGFRRHFGLGASAGTACAPEFSRKAHCPRYRSNSAGRKVVLGYYRLPACESSREMASSEAVRLLEAHPHRSPLDGEQIRVLSKALVNLKQVLRPDQAARAPVYSAILRLLKAHVAPLPNASVTFAQVQAARLQLLAEKLVSEGKDFPPELNAAITQGLVSGFEPTTRLRVAPEQQKALLSAQQVREREEVLLERQRLVGLQTDFQRTRASCVEAAKDKGTVEPTPEELLPWDQRRLQIPKQGHPRVAHRGLDSQTLLNERLRFLKLRTESVSQDIEKILEDHKSGKCKLSPREAALLETRVRHVKLLALQGTMRQTVWNEYQLSHGDGRRGGKRGKTLKQMQREFEKADRARIRQFETEERDARRKRQAWMNAMVDHLNKFRSYHRDVVKRGVRAVNKAVLKYHEEVAKNTSRAEREAEKARIQKLKDDDEEGYLELVRQTKNTRLLELLDQTDKYLRELGAVVKEERVKSGVVEYENDSSAKQGGRKNYYEIAHAIKEEVHTQSSLLVGGTLKEYQLTGIQWMVSLYNNRLNGILADEMGLGKTIQTLGLIAHLMERKTNPGPYLIIVPLSTISNWEMEFARWAPAIRVVVFKGDAKSRKRIYEDIIEKKSFNVCLVTYEYVVRGKNFLKRVEWQHLIIDEGHRIKNHESRLSFVLHTHYRSRNRLLLTGTPLQNSLTELWALLNFLLPNVFKSAESFESWFAAPFANMSVQNAAPAEQNAQLTEEESLLIIRRLHQVLRPFLLRRMKSDVLRMGEQLPEKQEHVILCDMSAWQRYMYVKIVKSDRLLFTDKHGRQRYDKLPNPAVQLRKCVNHPYLFFPDHASRIVDSPALFRSSGKFDMLDSIITKLLRTGHRLLIFNQMTKVVDLQERLLRYRNIPFYRLDGGTGTDDRRDMVIDFNRDDSDVNVFLLTTRAGGLGVNLQTADSVIIFDSDWNPSMDQQAQDRAHRIGQRREVLVLRMLTANSIEEDVMERASFKRGLEKKIIRAGMFDEQSKDSERQAMLRELLRVEGPASDDEQEQEDGLPTEEEVNRLLARSEEEFEIFTQIDEERKEEIAPRPSLLTEKEIPEWASKVPKSLLQKAKTSGAGSWAGGYGGLDLSLLNEPKKRRAATANVSYGIDQLSERQYIKLMERSEAGEDLSLSDAIRGVSGGRRKRRKKGEEASAKGEEEEIATDRLEPNGISAEDSRASPEATPGTAKRPPKSDTIVATKTLNADAKSFEDDMTEGGNGTGGEQSFAPSAGDDMIIEEEDDDEEDGQEEDKTGLNNEVADLTGSPDANPIRSDEDANTESSEEPPISRSGKDSRRRASIIVKDDSDSRYRKNARRSSLIPIKRRRRRSISSGDSPSASPVPLPRSRRSGSLKRQRIIEPGSDEEVDEFDVTTQSARRRRPGSVPRIPRVSTVRAAAPSASPSPPLKIRRRRPSPPTEPSENGEIIEKYDEAEDGEIREEGELSDEGIGMPTVNNVTNPPRLPPPPPDGPPPIPQLIHVRQPASRLGIDNTACDPASIKKGSQSTVGLLRPGRGGGSSLMARIVDSTESGEVEEGEEGEEGEIEEEGEIVE